MSHEQLHLVMRDSIKLSLDIKSAGGKDWLIFTHGIGEHYERHDYLLSLLGEKYNILRYDLRGHGKSEGQKGVVAQFSDYAKDLSQIIHYLKESRSMTNYVLMGHSMGCLIICDFLQNFVSKTLYPKKVFLSAPLVALSGAEGIIFFASPLNLAKVLSKLPSIALANLVNPDSFSHHPGVASHYMSDPQNNIKLETSLLFKMLAKARDVFSKPIRLKCPAYCVVGSSDKVVSPIAIEDYFGVVEKGVIVKVIAGGFHELHNEVDEYRDQYVEFLEESLC